MHARCMRILLFDVPGQSLAAYSIGVAEPQAAEGRDGNSLGTGVSIGGPHNFPDPAVMQRLQDEYTAYVPAAVATPVAAAIPPPPAAAAAAGVDDASVRCMFCVPFGYLQVYRGPVGPRYVCSWGGRAAVSCCMPFVAAEDAAFIGRIEFFSAERGFPVVSCCCKETESKGVSR